jgi:2,3-bisphosphoglycerate-independent phosphoglycerate mutase
MSNGTAAGELVVLVVLDGWGYREEREHNAIALARTPTWDALWSARPRTLLKASGLPVGLPEGQMGNSEVGHLNLGAGRVVPQDIVRISQAIRDGTFYRLAPLVELCDTLRRTGGTLHLVGLVGDGGVHAHNEHLRAAIDLGCRSGVRRIAVHALLDGRDTPPKSALGFVRDLWEQVRRADVPTTITTLIGRYYAMDRDRRWPRTKLAYDAMVHGDGTAVDNAMAGILSAYDRGETDEFVKPLVVRDAPRIQEDDAVFCFNFRADRMRQIVRALTADEFGEFDRGVHPKVPAVTMTMYDETFSLPHAFGPCVFAKIMAEVLSDAGLSQFRAAETEKYPHVTYFFNGGFEVPYVGEDRVLVPSPQVATYDLMPEMSAEGVTDVLCKAIEAKEHPFVLCNFANGDMVGHTGVLPAAVQAVETVDRCLARVLEAASRVGATLLVTADHGNCEVMVNSVTGEPHTAHTSNLVPLVAAHSGTIGHLREGGALCDVAPTILGLLGLEPPPEMTGRDLRAPAP